MTGCPADTWPEALRQRPVCPKRKLPIPFIAEVKANGEGEFTIFDETRVQQCLDGRLCAMCGDPMTREVALVGDRVALDPGGAFVEPPVHEGCALIAAGGLCPFLSHQRVPRRPMAEGLAPIGDDPASLAEVGRSIAKRPVIIAVCGGYDVVWTFTQTGSPVRLYVPVDLQRVRRYHWADGRLAEIGARAAGHAREGGRPVDSVSSEVTAAPAPALIRVQPRRQPRSERRANR